ncbi:hypothetical protein [Senegalimassilia anaerobia]
MAAVFLAARSTLARSSPFLEQSKKVFAMSGNGSVSCCAQPGALVVIAALPLCQLRDTLDSMEYQLFEGGFIPVGYDGEVAHDWQDLDHLEYGSALDWVLPGAFPLRCACVMDCADAVSLVQEVGHVVL